MNYPTIWWSNLTKIKSTDTKLMNKQILNKKKKLVNLQMMTDSHQHSFVHPKISTIWQTWKKNTVSTWLICLKASQVLTSCSNSIQESTWGIWTIDFNSVTTKSSPNSRKCSMLTKITKSMTCNLTTMMNWIYSRLLMINLQTITMVTKVIWIQELNNQLGWLRQINWFNNTKIEIWKNEI